ncbi:MAG: AzlC family ABC transporter permease [Coriobacteriia bacterium]|nr:AzlC family ABC transporter permease [Coriobacteriia bacterium]
MRLGSPIFLGYFPVGAAFGVLATTIGFTAGQAVACSATALAGAGQFVALELLRGGAGAVAVVAATTVVNLRYVLFGATLSPYLAGASAPLQSSLAFTLTDETFAVNVTDARRGLATSASMLGVGVVAWTGWVSGTALGAVTAASLGDAGAWGVQFAMPAMFTALLVAQVESRRHLWVAALAAAVALTASAALPGAWYILLATALAATAGAVTSR